ncbi:acetyl-lysine deacetylase [Halalkalicoccus paucihalophilus]|uniref:Acetyl-lysine deacetylase n=1 Tax=Halalkalicoccus paucihalophilus TaxID=1008153 RepID=A0A151AAM0_9EURY|nr:M20/M25/M40 family metallo-hydrolase [Halalkalicoccus paucihalophilus]KYH24685.1 acetyl-lysine deacetylase [Halalkalicoccus paucihalophilus]
MQPIEYLEQLLVIESHETVDEIQDYLLETVNGAQLDDTGCIYAVKDGVEGGPQLVLNTHMDVVSPHLLFERDGDIIRGRGACDAKGSLAAMVSAFSRIEPRLGSVKLIISPDEETTHRGLAAYLSEENTSDFAIVGEPSGLDICPYARGHYDLLVELYGESAHGATPDSGLNTTVCAAEAITRIVALPQSEDELVGTNNVTPTIIDGGNRPNQVPDYTRFVVDYRPIPIETRDDAVRTIQKALTGLNCDYEISFYEQGAALDSFKTHPEHEFVQAFSASCERITGDAVEHRPFDAATEAAVFAPSMPVVVFGPGLISDNGEPIAHSEREFVHASNVETATEILHDFLAEQLS